MTYGIYVEFKHKEAVLALKYLLEDKLELMKAQLGYVKTLTNSTIKEWKNGNLTEKDRLTWISETEAEIAKCEAHLAELTN